MARIISRHLDKPVPERPGPSAFYVRGRRHANSAAKFWAGLIDEVRQDFPLCTRVALTGIAAGALDARLLHPENALSEQLAELEHLDMREAMRAAVAELDILGPPSAVSITLRSNTGELLHKQLPLDCVDADLLPHLLSWLLSWSGIPECLWNNDTVTGAFCADDRRRGRHYAVTFRLAGRHLSEGLYERRIELEPAVTRLRAGRTPAPDPARGDSA